MGRPCENKHELTPDKCDLCNLSINSYYHQKKWGLEITVTKEQALEYARSKQLKNNVIVQPKIKTSIKNFCLTLTEHIKNKYKKTTQQQYEQRLKICSECPHKTEDWKCDLCGCDLNYKATWAVAKCDKKKWPLIVLSNKGCGCGSQSNKTDSEK